MPNQFSPRKFKLLSKIARRKGIGLIGVGLFVPVLMILAWLRRPQAPDELIAKAFVEERTLDLRPIKSKYVPVRARQGAVPFFTKSPNLVEAEFVIRRALDTRSADPSLFKAKAEVELLNWDYNSALETLNAASQLAPDSPPLFEDLGIAYFELAEKDLGLYRQQEYAASLENLSQAVQRDPQNEIFLFNRAIVLEKMSFLNQAIADWEQVLQIERNAGWRDEAQNRLAEIRRLQKRRTLVPSANRSVKLTTSFDLGTETDPELVIEAALQGILPAIAHPNDSSFAKISAMARYMGEIHDDRFLADLLTSTRNPDFHEAVTRLGRSSLANSKGAAESAYQEAETASSLFRRMRNNAGVAASEFEQAYALQFESKAFSCTRMAEESATQARKEKYQWIAIQSSIEQAICLNMQGDMEGAQRLCNEALRRAGQKGFRSFYLRSLLVKAGLESDAGDPASAFNDAHDGLNEFFRGGVSDIRAYSFYDLISNVADKSGFGHVRLAAALEQAAFFPSNPNIEVTTSARFRIANLALALGEAKIARQQFEAALQAVSGLPRTSSVKWRLLEAAIGLGRVELADPAQRDHALELLEAYSGEMASISNRYVEQEYYTTLGEIRRERGEIKKAESALTRAIEIAERSHRSVRSSKDELTWVEQNDRPYRLLTELLVNSHRGDNALAVWEKFRFTPFQDASRGPSVGTIRRRGETRFSRIAHENGRTVITYALMPDGILIWISGPKGTADKKVIVPEARFQRMAAKFIDECANPDSQISMLLADAHSLYGWLIGPIEAEIPKEGELYVRPDGILETLPWEALVDDSSSYLGQRYSFIMLPMFSGDAAQAGINPKDHALIVGVPGVAGVDEETQRVARVFLQPVVLRGKQANTARVKRELRNVSVFHFAGHAVRQQDGAALVLVDGQFRLSARRGGATAREDSQVVLLRNLRLAVFSACGTAEYGHGSTSSLVTEFLNAGTSAVIASRWKVDSSSTAQFMKAFYRNTASRGLTVSMGMHMAAVSMLEDPGHAHPYYWAAFGHYAGSK